MPKINFKNKSISIEEGKITKGIIDKTSFGEGDGELIKELDKAMGRNEAFQTIKKSFDLGKNYLSHRGISIAVNDFDLDKKIIKHSEEVVKESQEKTNEIIKSWKDGTLEIIPGKSAEQSREIKILQALNEVRTKVGEIVKKEFPETNPVHAMITSGGAGNMMQITQMACCVGQQAFMGGRIDIGYNERTLSFFEKGDLSPIAKGFINTPFMKGLRPDEFFFGAITGRDALMDTALRTPKSGYLYRRLANALQDIRQEYDGTVRDSSNKIIQFIYGDDGIDTANLHLNGKLPAGEAIGIIAAQSFGESSTQMVLRTFHMAGVAEMQVTQGLPRIIEIFDARKKPSSPKMDIYLNKQFNNEKDALLLAEKIKEITMEELASEISLNFSDKKINILIDKKALRQTQTTIKTIVERLQELNFKAKEKADSVEIDATEFSFTEIYKLKEKLKETIISGIKGVKQILISKRNEDYVIVTLGTNLKEVIVLKEVDETRTISNDLHEVAKVFGIEVARANIINEIKEVLNSQGLDINERHTKLLADTMTTIGVVKGVTRIGIIADKASILARATFETPTKQFVNATVKGSHDDLSSVIENIILNQPVPIGTGLPGLMVEVVGPLIKKEKDKKVAKKKVVDDTNK